MLGVVIHAPGDLRVEPVAATAPASGQVTVAIQAGGICGSDLHYYHHGGFGAIRIKEPMVLGHEIAGVISAVGADVSHIRKGTRVAVNPSQPCGHCRYCRDGQQRHCLDMRFLGSAMRFPHVQGGFRQSLTVRADQAVPISDGMTMAEAAMAEPLAVCLHAVRQAGPMLGRKVLVTGCGPIGILTVLAARLAGAVEIVATDLSAFTLRAAEQNGATAALNVAEKPDALSVYARDKGHFDVMFEASGASAALRGAFEALRPGAVIVQVGIGGDVTVPMNVLVAKELQLRGTFRFDQEFQLAVDLMGAGRIDVKPLVTETVAIRDADAAFKLASDRQRAMKVQLAFG
jgi:L-idonate 5-dehydrogenase